MAGIGGLLYSLLNGNNDPRAAILAGAGVPAPAAGTAPPASGPPVQPPQGPATDIAGAPASAPVAAAPGDANTPPDLSQLYLKLTERDRFERGINQGATLIAAGFAQPQNRAALLNMAAGGGAGSPASNEGSAVTTLQNLMKLQEMQRAQMIKNQLRGKLPAIAKQYNLDLDTVTMLFEQGKLDETLNALAQPKNVITTRSDGSTALIDERSGRTIQELSPPDKAKNRQVVQGPHNSQVLIDKGDPSFREEVVAGDPNAGRKVVQGPGNSQHIVDVNDPNFSKQVVAGTPDTVVVKRADGSQYLANKTDGTFVRELSPSDPGFNKEVTKDARGNTLIVDKGDPTAKPTQIAEGAPLTTDLKDLEAVNAYRARQGQPPIDPETWIKDVNASKAPKTSINLGNDKVAAEFAKTWVEDYKKADANREQITAIQKARDAVDRGIIAGSKLSTFELEGRKALAGIFGLNDEAANNTHVFMSHMKEIVLPRVKALGTGNSISNADREFVEKAVGGSIELTPQAIKRILTAMERTAIHEADLYNRRMREYVKKNPDVENLVRYVDVPRPSQQLLAGVSKGAIGKLLEGKITPEEFDRDENIQIPGAAAYFLEKYANGQQAQ